MRIRPYRTVDNVIDGVVITFIDITERKAAEVELAERERRFRALVEASSQIVWTTNAEGEAEEDSPSWRAFTGQTFEQWKGFGALDAVHPDDRQRTAALWKKALAEKTPIHNEYRLRNASGDWRWTAARAVPLMVDGTVTGWVGMNLDITERKRAETQNELLLHELNHRVKNTLATVVAIAQQTIKTSPSPEDFRQTFLTRIVALSNTHNLVTRAGWRPVALKALVEMELAPFQIDKHQPRWSMAGEDILLEPGTALALGLALHELSTNAAKYGALSAPSGRIEVTWRIANASDGRRLHLTWNEAGGPRVIPPKRKGFGTRLIEDGLTHELEGIVHIDYDPAGVRCTIAIPLPPEEEPR